MENKNQNYDYSEEEILEAKKEFADMLIKNMSPKILMEFVKLSNKLGGRG